MGRENLKSQKRRQRSNKKNKFINLPIIKVFVLQLYQTMERQHLQHNIGVAQLMFTRLATKTFQTTGTKIVELKLNLCKKLVLDGVRKEKFTKSVSTTQLIKWLTQSLVKIKITRLKCTRLMRTNKNGKKSSHQYCLNVMTVIIVLLHSR